MIIKTRQISVEIVYERMHFQRQFTIPLMVGFK